MNAVTATFIHARMLALREQFDQLVQAFDGDLPCPQSSPDELLTVTGPLTAEAALQASELRFRTSLETMLDAFGIYRTIRDEAGHIVDFQIEYVNPAACASNKLSYEQQVGKRLFELLPREFTGDLFVKYCELVETGQPLNHELLIYTDIHGERQIISAFDIRASRLGDGVVAAWRDTTERKQAEQQLAVSQGFVQSITELLPTAIYIFDLTTQENIYCNRQIAELLGYNPEEIQAMDRNFVPQLLHPDDQHLVVHMLAAQRNAADGEVLEHEFRLRHRNGSWRWMHCRETAFRRDETGQVYQSIGQVEDVTKQRMLNAQVHVQANLLNQVADAVVAIDLEFRISSWNAAAERIYGWSAAEAIGQNFNELLATRYEATSVEEVGQILLTTGSWSGELEQRRRDGSFVPMQSSVTLLRDQEGNPSGAVGVNRDISERRHTDRLLQAANSRLEQAIIEAHRRTAEVVQINQLHDLLQVCQSRDETSEVISLSLAKLFPDHHGYLAVREHGKRNLRLLSHWGADSAPRKTLVVEECWALRRGHLHCLTPDTPSPRCRHSLNVPAAYRACLPLSVQGETFGLLSLAGAVEPRSELLVSVGDAIKLALANIDLREALREQATHDALTGLFNRRYLEATLPRELQRACRESSQLCVAMIDIDHFKRFNDRYGHDAGDALLREVAWAFHNGTRKSDIACRYGGEEFILVMPGSAPHETLARIEQLRATIRTLQIDFLGRRLDPVSISVGIAAYSGEENWLELIRTADEALYAAKAAGRDQALIAERPTVSGKV